MEQLNVVGFETPFGFRTIELNCGDITQLEPRASVLVVSAYAGSYHPVPGTVFEALLRTHMIDANALSCEPAIDLRSALGVWLSGPMDTGPASRILCVHMQGHSHGASEALENAFAALMLIEAKGINTNYLALPMLGAGQLGLDPDILGSNLVTHAKRYLSRSVATKLVRFVEIDEVKARLISDAMDRTLGRVRVSLPQKEVTTALLQDILNKLSNSSDLFKGDAAALRGDWIRMLQQPRIRAFEFGVLARKLVELLLTRLDVPQKNLAGRIRMLETQSFVAPWICGYMHLLRHLGNESAHARIDEPVRVPPAVGVSDLTAGLYCVERLLEFWQSHEANA